MDAAKAGPTVMDLTQTLDIVKLVSKEDKVFYLNRDVAC